MNPNEGRPRLSGEEPHRICVHPHGEDQSQVVNLGASSWVSNREINADHMSHTSFAMTEAMRFHVFEVLFRTISFLVMHFEDDSGVSDWSRRRNPVIRDSKASRILRGQIRKMKKHRSSHTEMSRFWRAAILFVDSHVVKTNRNVELTTYYTTALFNPEERDIVCDQSLSTFFVFAHIPRHIVGDRHDWLS